MDVDVSERLDSAKWKDLYRAALFEDAAPMRLVRIREAERALVVRARELFNLAEHHIDEKFAIDETMYALHTLVRRPMMTESRRHLDSQTSEPAEQS